MLRGAVKAYEQRHLREAQKAYEKRLETIRQRPLTLPTTAENRRELLTLIMTGKPELGSALLTAQHREFKEWTDADVQSCLEELAALGVLDEFQESSDDER